MTLLKPLSPAFKQALALLGETPEEHQKFQLESKKKLSLREKNKAVLKGTLLEPASSIVKKWAFQEGKIPIVWLADARVLFIRNRLCLHCGAKARELHWPETFIRQRKQGSTSTDCRYTPAKSEILAEANLPRIAMELECKVYNCPSCPEWQTSEQPMENPVCLADLLLSPPAGIGSPMSASGDTQAGSRQSSESQSPPLPKSNGGLEADDTSVDSRPILQETIPCSLGLPVLAFESSARDQLLAAARHILSRTPEASTV